MEQRDIKQLENIDEFEKVADSTNMNDINEEVLENDAQNKNAQAKSGINTESRRKQLDNVCLRNVNVGSLEEAQTHLKPTIIDTSLVKGNIIQASYKIFYSLIISQIKLSFYYFKIFVKS